MELTTKGRYAVMAMADLASQATAHATAHGDAADKDLPAVPLSQIAERQTLPLAYLEQLFVQLRRAGLVDSARGRTGGYRLARAAGDISVADVMAAVDEDTRFTRCADGDPRCSRETPCLTHGLWQGLSDTTASYLAGISLQQVVADAPTMSAVRKSARPAAASVPAARVYLDYNATAPLRPEAKAAMIAALEVPGNASSVHGEGRAARRIVETAREQVAALVGCKPSEVVFTSGATESNAWVIGQPWSTIFAAGIEHDSIMAPLAAAKCDVERLVVDGDGIVNIEDFAARFGTRMFGNTALLTLQAANNETGILQPLGSAIELARAHGLRVHTDAVQAAGRVVLNFTDLDIDLMSVSAHKLGGPKGAGALIVRDHYDLVPLLRGGGQERRRRAGTENLAAIAGFGAAAEVAASELANFSAIAQLRDTLEAGIRAITPGAVIIGAGVPRLANTTALAVSGHAAESLVIKFDLAGFAISAGSACSSGKVGASHVLQAMGTAPDIARGVIRISLGPLTTAADVSNFIAAWGAIVRAPALAA